MAELAGLRPFMEFHPWYLREVLVEGEEGKVVFDGDDGDENVGVGKRLALFPER